MPDKLFACMFVYMWSGVELFDVCFFVYAHDVYVYNQCQSTFVYV